MNGARALQEEIDRLISAHEGAKARLRLADLWRTEPGPALAGFVASRFERLGRGPVHCACKLAVLRSFTVEPVVIVLRAAAQISGIEVSPQVGGFNTYAQEVLDGNSRLYRFMPDIVILAVQTRDIAPDLWDNAGHLSPQEIEAAVNRVTNGYRDWLEAFRGQSQAHLIIHNLEMPMLPGQGILDDQRTDGQTHAIREINYKLQQMVRAHLGVYVLDYDALVARFGRTHWHDERKWLAMRMPIAANCLVHLANEWLRFLHPLTGRLCKALVVDLDNTLWGGVVGEAGVQGIVSSPEYPGAAYQAVQRVLVDLHRRGILLAICSKNNAADAMEALQTHPGLLVRPEHFAALRINWNEKSRNLREIAQELNIGIDAIAFLDDNPVERQQVRLELPEVFVIEPPGDPMDYARALREAPVFERLTLSEEDRDRGQLYVAQRQRSELQQSRRSLEEFYRSLEQEVELAPAGPDAIPRVSQLTQKTNQFNVTTRRYSEQQIAEMIRQPGVQIFTARVRDRFGDNGLVGLAIIRTLDNVCEIDTFLLSCRVIGRAVETVMLSHLVDQAKSRGLKRVQGWFVPTQKNAPAKDFYAAHGFSEQEHDGSGSIRWSLETEASRVAAPQWTKVTIRENGH
jgi:FkbH-like protein